MLSGSERVKNGFQFLGQVEFTTFSKTLCMEVVTKMFVCSQLRCVLTTSWQWPQWFGIVQTVNPVALARADSDSSGSDWGKQWLQWFGLRQTVAPVVRDGADSDPSGSGRGRQWSQWFWLCGSVALNQTCYWSVRAQNCLYELAFRRSWKHGLWMGSAQSAEACGRVAVSQTCDMLKA